MPAYDLILYRHGKAQPETTTTADITPRAAKARALRMAVREDESVDVFTSGASHDVWENYLGTASCYGPTLGAYWHRSRS